ncbi:hypothetical protein AYO21_11437 [Fonsecaea monophora]|uniref:Uncharacterized protein n=1 Tax=Fonsecaea monophora TaxID=254056 RepID=A0A177ETL9_9EURO|nr:hypothetical protein AYO21_11437 [Fonsecaea monophora]KAH0841142.1 hypothetical protein FOPE_06179 [Fonsecaea pedrosoi]OAG34412.1 hypothetical protein AYO21_11437 [Fonsecaea monophora]
MAWTYQDSLHVNQTDTEVLPSDASLVKMRPARTRRIHWRAPTLMVASFITALIGAVSHHVLYLCVDGRAITFDVEQQVVTSAGLVLAFLVKVLLAISSSIAFTQCLWCTLRLHSVDVRSMDSLFGVLGNPFELLNLRFWFGHPVLTLTAATTWLIPLSAIFTPATISVGPKMHSSAVRINVAQRDAFLANRLNKLDDGSWRFPGVSTMLNYLSQLSLVEASLLTVSGGSSNQNLSYTQSFYGPAVQCVAPNNETRSFITTAMEESINETGDFLFWTAFYPFETFGPDMNGTFFNNIVASESATDPNLGLDLISKDAAKVYHTLYLSDNMTIIPSADGYLEILECSLHNASYDVRFELHGDGQQTITATRELLEPVPASVSLPGNVTETDAAEMFEYLTLMQSYVVYVIGATTTSPLYVSDWRAIQFSSLVASPVLGSYLMPSEDHVNLSDFTAALESLFENFTLSYRFGEVPESTIDTPKQFNAEIATPATLHRSLNTFSYNPRTLIVAYSIVIALAAACLACGITALYRNGVSYTNNFSTILRVTRDKRFDALIEDDEDRAGADPLPRHVGDVVVTYVGEGEVEAAAVGVDAEAESAQPQGRAAYTHVGFTGAGIKVLS